MDVNVSGRTPIAVIDALWTVQKQHRASAGTRQLARQIYVRTGKALERVHAEGGDDGTVPRIVIDDRCPGSRAESAPEAEARDDPGERDRGDAE